MRAIIWRGTQVSARLYIHVTEERVPCGGRYVLWLIVLLSLTYFQFTATARRFVSWLSLSLSIVHDERRFMMRHPARCCCSVPAYIIRSSDAACFRLKVT